MTEQTYAVLDASVGVKWFKPEPGQEDALALVERAATGEVTLAVPAQFIHEVLAVVRRLYRPSDVVDAWDKMMAVGIVVVPLTREIVVEAAAQCEALGCLFYDALAPALATALDAKLYSADSAAHAHYPGVTLVAAY